MVSPVGGSDPSRRRIRLQGSSESKNGDGPCRFFSTDAETAKNQGGLETLGAAKGTRAKEAERKPDKRRERGTRIAAAKICAETAPEMKPANGSAQPRSDACKSARSSIPTRTISPAPRPAGAGPAPGEETDGPRK